MKLEEAKACYYACVYCLEFPNGMKYVGKTKNLSNRVSVYLKFNNSNKGLSSAIEEFGWGNISVNVLSRVDCKDSIDLDLCLSILEIKYIRELNTLSPNGYNISLGGECLGIPIEHITTDKDAIKRFNGGSKAILLYDLNGDFIAEYPSIARMSYDLSLDESLISALMNTKKILNNRWYLREKKYDYAPKHIELAPPVVRENIIYKDVVVERDVVKYKNVIVRREVEKLVERKVIKKPHILKYDMNGDFCGEYDNLKEACMSFANSPSGIVCGSYRKGYILFEKENDDFPKQIEPYHILSKKILGKFYRPASELSDKSPKIKKNDGEAKKAGRPRKEIQEKKPLSVNGRYTNIINKEKVEQYDLNGNLVATHKSIRDAAADTGLNYANIWACAMGRTKKSQGYIWKLVPNEEILKVVSE